MKLKPYPKYKGSGVEWLGAIPEQWSVSQIGRLFEIHKRISGELGHDVLSITQRGIQVKDIESNDGQLSMDYSKYQIVEVGDFAMNHMDLITGFIDLAQFPGVTSPDYRVFRHRKTSNVEDRYFLAVFQDAYLRKLFFPFGQGSSQLGRWRLPTESFKSYPILVPSIDEQSAIATFIDRETAKLETLIAKQEKLIEFINERIMATVMAAMTSAETEYIRFGYVCEVISRPVIQAPDDSFTRLGILNRGRGLFKREEADSEDMGDSDFFWVKKNDLILSGQFAWEGSVAMAQDAHDGCVVSHRFPIIRGVSGVVLTEYLFALLMTPHGDFLLNENSRGSAGRNRPLNLNLLLKEKIPIASMTVQNEVAKLLTLRSKLIEKAKRSIELCKEHRTALISAAVTGKIDVRNYA
ncbi:restriction endonuclease subunit S [Methylophilus medardicus]|uniref:Restriction endonuclease n=1 Tax=Methylophilus medardicus TaxID=2588534 RepID=A0A5B8CTN9_9PROT|nr:restriction endonuclease subunit S [Methylophilus medardicus]QDC44599.1 restriction endonuclease [Methylophilus medardicus]QDC49606.1 restriction endonuclease [Methylophilus medardicus]QDC53311.1 restriction endonuclease [Methylophilus medardicus]